MGTRADFYIGRGPTAEWLGSIAYDGYPEGVPDDLLAEIDAGVWRTKVVAFIAPRQDGTLPEHGWPWPWEDSNTTDFAYAIDGGKVYANSFGHGWFHPVNPEEAKKIADSKPTDFPDMKAQQAVTFAERAGLMIFTA